MKTKAEKRAISRETTRNSENRKRALGLKKSTLWIPDDEDEVTRIKNYIAKRIKAKGITL